MSVVAYYGTDTPPVVASAPAATEEKPAIAQPAPRVCSAGTCGTTENSNDGNIVTFVTASIGTLPPLLWILLALILYVENSISRKLFETNAKLDLLLSVYARKNVVVDGS